MKTGKTKSMLDEMQQSKLLGIQETGFGICCFGLLAAVLIQLLLGCGFRQVLGELIVLAAASGYFAWACLKNGLWSPKATPCFKTNALASIVPAALIGILGAIRIFAVAKIPFTGQRALELMLSMAAVYLGCLGVLEIFRHVHGKRRKALDGGEEESEGKKDVL